LGAQVFVPPGDDMAAMRWSAGDLLAAVDQCVDGVHVDAARMSMAQIGRKAMKRSLSDIAAMAERPVASLAAATLPAAMSDESACALADAMRESAQEFNAPLIGGDLARHRHDGPLVISVTVLAGPGPVGALVRSGAQVGDGVYVTGELGATLHADGGGHHLTFTPRINAALWLARQLGERLHAMIDISDGLGRDAGHLAQDSGVDLQLDARSIPRRDACSIAHSVMDGEDYELCFTAAGDVPRVTSDGVRITRVGSVVAAGEPGAVGAWMVNLTEVDIRELRALGESGRGGRGHRAGSDGVAKPHEARRDVRASAGYSQGNRSVPAEASAGGIRIDSFGWEHDS
ncbi:MAG: thiamine-monophosphate kinase, partial [Phycisphaerales bacterium]|nr:thiamine-monophosphate kinase [Phycisphaerales bacterium]